MLDLSHARLARPYPSRSTVLILKTAPGARTCRAGTRRRFLFCWYYHVELCATWTV